MREGASTKSMCPHSRSQEFEVGVAGSRYYWTDLVLEGKVDTRTVRWPWKALIGARECCHLAEQRAANCGLNECNEPAVYLGRYHDCSGSDQTRRSENCRRLQGLE